MDRRDASTVSRVRLAISSRVIVIVSVFLALLLVAGPATAYTETASPAADLPGTSTVLSYWWWIPLGIGMAFVFLGRRGSRLARVPRQPWTFKPSMGYCFVLLAFVAGAIGAQVGLWFTEPTEVGATPSLRDLTIITAVSLGFQGAVLLAMPGWWVPRSPGQEDHRPSIPVSAWYGALALLCFFPIVQGTMVLMSLFSNWFSGEPTDQLAHQSLVALAEAGSTPWKWAYMGLLALVGPIVEEVMYRGLLQESLRRHRILTGGSSWSAIMISSVIFTSMHIGVTTWESLPSLMVLSVGLGWVFARTGRLIACITMHIGFNALNLLLAALI